ncbi:hypothetical protein GYMLUDRAFT_86073 [Collybiopsis luxurians FD-317 M1]|uniref:Cerato-platanin n=1 Tax=Collybiopsis luxurians FD-317 M1 TaxID=944289 RepID=A0A0D0CKY4_9AGAR|nr:hypothetical protein GYMLUDRAFT_86073 [Collybiopsis luxurians FD-317 M1]
MKFLTTLFVSAAAATLTAAETLEFDTVYDNGSQSINTVACHRSGLLPQNVVNFASLPTFPNIGAFGQIVGFDSPYCGSCWEVTYTNAQGQSTSLNVTAIDHAEEGLIKVSQEAMDRLTNGNAVALGAVPVSAVQVAASACGL